MKRRSAMACALAIIFLLAATTNAAAYDGGKTKYTVNESFIELIKPLYLGNSDTYEITGNRGYDAKAEMYTNTKTFADKNDWQSVYDYYWQNIASIKYTTMSYKDMRSGERSKTVSQYYSATVPGISGNHYDMYSADVVFKLTGTIFYDPNTFVVSSTSPAVVSEINVNPAGELKNAITDVTKRTYSATFDASVYTYLGFWDSVTFAPVNGSITINAD